LRHTSWNSPQSSVTSTSARPNSPACPPSTSPPSAAVADAEHRQPGLVERRRRHRRVAVKHRSRAAGQDHATRLHFGESLAGLLERRDLAVDALLAHSPRDQLRDLGTEIDDQDLLVQAVLIHCGALAGAERQSRENACRRRYVRRTASQVKSGPFHPGPGDRSASRWCRKQLRRKV
jgi:hypothetical protein